MCKNGLNREKDLAVLSPVALAIGIPSTNLPSSPGTRLCPIMVR